MLADAVKRFNAGALCSVDLEAVLLQSQALLLLISLA